MRRKPTLLFLACLFVLPLAGPLLGDALPVRGIHLAAPKPAELPLAMCFISEALPKEGVNVLIL